METQNPERAAFRIHSSSSNSSSCTDESLIPDQMYTSVQHCSSCAASGALEIPLSLQCVKTDTYSWWDETHRSFWFRSQICVGFCPSQLLNKTLFLSCVLCLLEMLLEDYRSCCFHCRCFCVLLQTSLEFRSFQFHVHDWYLVCF